MPENGNNFWQDYVLDAAPEAAFYSAAPFGGAGGGFSPSEEKYWRGQYGNVMNQYMGSLGQSLRQGQDPSATSFVDFLSAFPWTDRYMQSSPRNRPGFIPTSRFAPAVRRFF